MKTTECQRSWDIQSPSPNVLHRESKFQPSHASRILSVKLGRLDTSIFGNGLDNMSQTWMGRNLVENPTLSA
jgi:hypothetical protein